MTNSPAGTAGSLTSAADFFTRAQRFLLDAKRDARSPAGREALLRGAALLNSPEFDALPEQARDDLNVLYAEAFQRVHGSLIA